MMERRDRAILEAMHLTVPADLEARLGERTVSRGLAVGLYVSEEVTLGEAARIAGLTQGEFLRELGKRGIPLRYGPEELAEDLATVDKLAAR